MNRRSILCLPLGLLAAPDLKSAPSGDGWVAGEPSFKKSLRRLLSPSETNDLARAVLMRCKPLKFPDGIFEDFADK